MIIDELSNHISEAVASREAVSVSERVAIDAELLEPMSTEISDCQTTCFFLADLGAWLVDEPRVERGCNETE